MNVTANKTDACKNVTDTRPAGVSVRFLQRLQRQSTMEYVSTVLISEGNDTMNAPPEPEYHVPPSSADFQPPSSGQVIRYILVCLFTSVLVVYDVFVMSGIVEQVTQYGLIRAIQIEFRDHTTPFALALLPLAGICLTIVWLDRHTVLKPRMTTSPRACIGYVVLLGWMTVMLVLGCYAMTPSY